MTTLLPPLPPVDFREQRLTSAEIAVKNGKLDKEKIAGASEDFEALLLQQMFDSMWSSVPEGGLLDGGSEAEFYRDLLNQQLAKEIAHSQSIGLKKTFAEDMARVEGKEVSERRDLGVG